MHVWERLVLHFIWTILFSPTTDHYCTKNLSPKIYKIIRFDLHYIPNTWLQVSAQITIQTNTIKITVILNCS